MENYLSSYRFNPFASYPGLNDPDGLESQLQPGFAKEQSRCLAEVGIPCTKVEEEETICIPLRSSIPAVAEPVHNKKPITIVIPCYNEELILPYLDNTLKSVEAELNTGHLLSFVFVDDCSTDGTWDSL